MWIDIDAQSEIRYQAPAGDAIHIQHNLGSQPAAIALVGDGRIGEAVRQNDAAPGQRGKDQLVHILRAAGKHEQKFGGGCEFLVRGIEQNAADLLADAPAAGLRGFDYCLPVRAEAFGEHAHLGRFAAAVEAFEGDEEATRRIALSQQLSAFSSDFRRARGASPGPS